jgi:hypothetical protein
MKQTTQIINRFLPQIRINPGESLEKDVSFSFFSSLSKSALLSFEIVNSCRDSENNAQIGRCPKMDSRPRSSRGQAFRGNDKKKAVYSCNSNNS